MHPGSPVGRTVGNAGGVQQIQPSPMMSSAQQSAHQQQPQQYSLSKSPQQQAFTNKSPSHSMQISNLIGGATSPVQPQQPRLNLVSNNTVVPNSPRVAQQQPASQQVSFSHQPPATGAMLAVNNQAAVVTTQNVIRSSPQQQQPVQIPLIKQSPLPSVSLSLIHI